MARPRKKEKVQSEVVIPSIFDEPSIDDIKLKTSPEVKKEESSSNLVSEAVDIKLPETEVVDIGEEFLESNKPVKETLKATEEAKQPELLKMIVAEEAPEINIEDVERVNSIKVSVTTNKKTIPISASRARLIAAKFRALRNGKNIRFANKSGINARFAIH